MEEIKDIVYKPLCPVTMLDTSMFTGPVLHQLHQNVTTDMFMHQSVSLGCSYQLTEKPVILHYLLLSAHWHNSSKWQPDHIMHWAHFDSLKRPFISPAAVTEVKLLNNHRACSLLTDGSPKGQQSVAGFGGWRDAAVPIWLGKQSWGLICPTPLQKRGCNSIGSWPTVLPYAGTAAQALLKKPHWGNVPVSAPLRMRHAGCATPRVLVLSFCFF